MTTLLEHLLHLYLGKASSTNGNGESYWPCPNCGDRRFHTMPVHPIYAHRAKCWHCDLYGDAADMLKFFHPDESWDVRKARLKQFASGWQTLNQKSQAKEKHFAVGRGVSKPKKKGSR